MGALDVSVMRFLTPGGYGLGVLGVDADTGSCVFSGCAAGADFEIYGLNGEIPGAATRVWYEPTTDTLLVVYLNRNGASLDEPLLAFLASLR
jgi:hypothetical protein